MWTSRWVRLRSCDCAVRRPALISPCASSAHVFGPVSGLLRAATPRPASGPEAPVCGVTSARFRVLFKRACASLGLDASYVPHSLRHGGATYLAMTNVSVADIKLRGRWRSLDTLERYVQTGEAVIGSVRAPASAVELGRTVARDVLSAFHALASSSRAAPATSFPARPAARARGVNQ